MAESRGGFGVNERRRKEVEEIARINHALVDALSALADAEERAGRLDGAEAFAAEHGLAALLDHLGLDGLGNQVVAAEARVQALEEALGHENYRGTVCVDCEWDASFQPPEVTRCLQCGGELVQRYVSGPIRVALSVPQPAPEGYGCAPGCRADAGAGMHKPECRPAPPAPEKKP